MGFIQLKCKESLYPDKLEVKFNRHISSWKKLNVLDRFTSGLLS